MQSKISPTVFSKTWPLLVDLALRMPELFPEHSLPILSPSHPSLLMSREQTACLVIHQFLCTLTAPTWQEGYQDFHIWYSSEQPHSGAVEAYLTALFTYFERLASENETSPLAFGIEEWPVTYTLHTNLKPSKHAYHDLEELEVVYLDQASTAPEVLGLPNGAAVISANKFIGFGRTGTQEEVHVGASPECCPAVLITPPLEDDQVLVVIGPEAMISISGYGRDAHCSDILSPSIQSHRDRWAKRTMLFMDALELDLADQIQGLPDLAPGNIQREIKKAYIAFRSNQGVENESAPYAEIYTGFWGCRTFGGNPAIKAMIQWCAASLAGCNLKFICSNGEQEAFGIHLEDFVVRMRVRRISPRVLEKVLCGLNNSDLVGGKSPFDVVLGRMPKVHIIPIEDAMEQVPFSKR